MITFRQYLSEILQSEAPKKWAEQIVQDCSFYLHEVKFDIDEDHALYRGMKFIEVDPFSKLQARSNRPPRDTSKPIHDVMDNFFYKHFGFKYRSAGTFAIGSSDKASMYANPYLIFPIGKFSYVWSPKVEDAYASFASTGRVELQDEIEKVAKQFGYELTPQEQHNPASSPLWPEMIALYLDENPDLYKDTGLFQAASEYPNNEVILACKSYYIVPSIEDRYIESYGYDDELVETVDSLLKELDKLI